MNHFLQILILVMFAMFGCSAETPLTLDEEEPPKIEVVEETPLPDTPIFTVDVVEIGDIVADTTAGNESYERRLVTLTATIKEMELTPDGNGYISLFTNAENVFFFLRTSRNAEAFADYEFGETYEFTVYIFLQEHRPGDIVPFSIDAIYAKKGLEEVAFETLLSDAEQNNKRYQGRVVRFTATIEHILPDDSLVIKTDRNNFGFSIEGADLGPEEYVVDHSYTFTVFVAGVGDGKPEFNPHITCFFFK
ncbi:MAG: hypothetical protein OXI43_01965 [Candidatus Poribacteria bacterium]|nr:hypothetical protein [Candidatus Poribacteria bacterium]